MACWYLLKYSHNKNAFWKKAFNGIYKVHSILKVLEFVGNFEEKPNMMRCKKVTHICISKLIIFGSDNGLSPGWREASIWTNAGILLIGPLGTNFSEILIEIYTFWFTKMHLKMWSGKWRPFCLGLNVLKANRSFNLVSDGTFCYPVALKAVRWTSTSIINASHAWVFTDLFQTFWGILLPQCRGWFWRLCIIRYAHNEPSNDFDCCNIIETPRNQVQ